MPLFIQAIFLPSRLACASCAVTKASDFLMQVNKNYRYDLWRIIGITYEKKEFSFMTWSNQPLNMQPLQKAFM